MNQTFDILGMGWALPKTEIDNDFLHKEVGLRIPPRWAMSRLGIAKRYTCLSKEYIVSTKNADPVEAMKHAIANGVTPVTLGAEAALMALHNAGVRADQVGMIICNCDFPFVIAPGAAGYIAKAIGVGNGPHMDVNTACSSFARHMKVLGDTRLEAWPEYVLTIQTGCYTTRTSYASDSFDGYIWGDGAAAQVCSIKHQGRLKVEPLFFESDPTGVDDVKVEGTGHFVQDGTKVREFSIRKTVELFEAIASAKGLYAEEVYTVTHQANAVMMKSIIGHLHLPQERHIMNVVEQGNIAGAGMPSAVAQRLDTLKKGDQIVYAVLGAGLAWGGGLMEVR
ncbi:MAG: 3-oxoacyl-[acyl-carrier-protein] synthase III C-terminal domain-containing protein [Elusimicrobiota bacterium]|nr:3-oxoacyl-[acyl-carrier-protein] synthase III C-terminal domain-containing protein [Elusimicrobiota bacterium]